jgi:hypothetical protein
LFKKVAQAAIAFKKMFFAFDHATFCIYLAGFIVGLTGEGNTFNIKFRISLAV